MNSNEMNMLMEDKEIWIDIKNSNGEYKVSQFGNLKSFKKYKQGINLEGHLKCQFDYK